MSPNESFRLVWAIYTFFLNVLYHFFKNVLYYFFFETRARVSPGPDLDRPWTGLALIYEGQGQGRQNQVRAGPDRPVDSLVLTPQDWKQTLPKHYASGLNSRTV